MPPQLLLTGGQLLQLDRRGMITARHADLLIENGVVRRVAPRLADDFPGVRRLDASGCLVMAGLTNAHTHSPENLAAGFCDGMRLEGWLDAVWGRLDHLSGEEIRLAVLSGVAQMLKQGVTAVVDHFRQTPMSIEAFESAASAYRESGIRAVIAVMARDRVDDSGRLIGARTGGAPLSLEATRELWTEMARRHAPGSRVALGIGPSGPTRCSTGMLELAAELAERYPLFLHTHVAETRLEAETATSLYGCRSVQHLADVGFLGLRTSLAHCVWVDEAEIGLISRSGAVVAHNPVSNMVLGSGIAPVDAMLQAGARVALGTDGAASNGAQDMLETVKCAALLARCGTADPQRWLSAGAVLAMALEGGRRIFGMDLANLAEGAVADVAAFEVPDIALDEFSDPVRQFVYGARSPARHVVVGGEALVVDGSITSFDEPAQSQLKGR